MVTYQAKSVKAGKDLYNRLEWRAEFSYPGRRARFRCLAPCLNVLLADWTQFNKLQSTDKDYRASAHGYSNHCMLAVGIYMLYHPSGTLFVTMAVRVLFRNPHLTGCDNHTGAEFLARRGRQLDRPVSH